MYNSLCRRGGDNRPADAHARQVSADSHCGTTADFLRRHERESAEAARGTKADRANFASYLFQRATDSRNLYLALEHLARNGGEAPGPDGLRPGDLNAAERWSLARALEKSLRSETYQPGPHRETKVPKGGDRGTRTLQIQDIGDRAVQRAIVQALQPFLDPRFTERSFGFRPHMGREHALATAELLATRSNLWVWDTEDIQDAFDQVPLKRLMDILRRHTPAEDFLKLVETVIRNDRKRGLRQGGALSPLLLNVYLDHVLDRPWQKTHPTAPLIRVADDLLVLAEDRDQAVTLRTSLKSILLPAGMPLKESKSAIRDLASGQRTEWLGFDIRRGTNGVEPLLTERSWERLEEALTELHDKPDAPDPSHRNYRRLDRTTGTVRPPGGHPESPSENRPHGPSSGVRGGT